MYKLVRSVDVLIFSRYDSKSSENGNTVDAGYILIYPLDTIATNFPRDEFSGDEKNIIVTHFRSWPLDIHSIAGKQKIIENKCRKY